MHRVNSVLGIGRLWSSPDDHSDAGPNVCGEEWTTDSRIHCHDKGLSLSRVPGDHAIELFAGRVLLRSHTKTAIQAQLQTTAQSANVHADGRRRDSQDIVLDVLARAGTRELLLLIRLGVLEAPQTCGSFDLQRINHPLDLGQLSMLPGEVGIQSDHGGCVARWIVVLCLQVEDMPQLFESPGQRVRPMTVKL